MDEATKLLLELDSTIWGTHLDMGGKDTYTLTHNSYPVIKRIKVHLSNIASQSNVDASTVKPCSNCGSTKVMTMNYCAHCGEEK